MCFLFQFAVTKKFNLCYFPGIEHLRVVIELIKLLKELFGANGTDALVKG